MTSKYMGGKELTPTLAEPDPSAPPTFRHIRDTLWVLWLEYQLPTPQFCTTEHGEGPLCHTHLLQAPSWEVCVIQGRSRAVT